MKLYFFCVSVCRQIKEGIAAVFGPINKVPRAHVQSICNAFEIPHLQAQWDSRENRDYFSISVYPDAQTLSRAYAELLKEWHWKQFTVIYEDNDGRFNCMSPVEQLFFSVKGHYCLTHQLTYVLGAQKNRLIETVLLNTHNICLQIQGSRVSLTFVNDFHGHSPPFRLKLHTL